MANNNERERKFGNHPIGQVFADIQSMQMLDCGVGQWLMGRFSGTPIGPAIERVIGEKDLNVEQVPIKAIFESIRKTLFTEDGRFMRVDRNGAQISVFPGITEAVSIAKVQQVTQATLDQVSNNIPELQQDLKDGKFKLFFTEGVSEGEAVVLLEKQDFIYDPSANNAEVARLLSRRFILFGRGKEPKELEFTEMWYYPHNPRLMANEQPPFTAITILDGMMSLSQFNRSKESLINRYSDVREKVADQTIFAPLGSVIN